jgi:CBS domain-containing protein
MFDQPIRSIMEQKKFLAAPPQTTVSQAARLMADKNVGAVLVIENERLVGIFTERDVVFRVIAQGRDAKTTPLVDVMTAAPKTLDPGKSYGHALVIMQENGFRHMPVVENGRPVGIISSRNAMDPDLEEFVADERRREFYR